MSDSRSDWQKAVDDMFWGGEALADRQRRVEDERRERWFQTMRINPSAGDLRRMCLGAAYGDLRGLLHDGDLYWWDSLFGTHLDAQHWMKISGSKLDAGLELHTLADGEVGLSAFEDAVLEAAMKHPTLRGRISADYTLVIPAGGRNQSVLGGLK